MLTRGRKARVAVRPDAAHAALPPLPLLCVLDVLSRLSPGERLLSSAVSRGWRAAVCQPSLWESVDLEQGWSDALLAARRAQGCWADQEPTPSPARRRGVDHSTCSRRRRGQRGALRHLELRSTPFRAADEDDVLVRLYKDEVDEMLYVAKGLLSFDVDVQCTSQYTQTLLAGQGQYSVVHIRRLFVDSFTDDESMLHARDVRLHPFLKELSMADTPLRTPTVLGALVDAVSACGLIGLSLGPQCELGTQSATHLARLLRDAPHLSTLLIDDDALIDVASSPVLAAALRASSLSVLRLESVELWSHEGVGNVVVDALVGHPTLQEISLAWNAVFFDDLENTTGACLARLVTSNSPCLHELSLANCRAGDDVLRPIFVALASNTFLRTLFMQDNNLSSPFVRDMVPSIRANSTLRRLAMTEAWQDCNPALLEVEALVAARR